MILQVFLEFVKIGIFSIGGGLATIPFLYHLTQTRPTWITVEELTNILAIGQSTPGPIGVNISTYVGNNILGILGSFIAPFSLVLPSFLIILVIVHYYHRYENNLYVVHYFNYIRVASLALISYAVTFIIGPALTLNNEVNMVCIGFFVILFVVENIFKKVSPIVFIILSALIAIILF